MASRYISKLSFNLLWYLFSILIVSSLCRVAFIFTKGLGGKYFEINSIFWGDLAQTLFSGLRYDARFAAYLVIIYLVLYLLFSFTKKRGVILLTYATVSAGLIIVATACNIAFFDIYSDTFNAILLGLIYDDRQAIAQTAMSGDYNIIFRTICASLAIVLYFFIFRAVLKFLNKNRDFKLGFSVLLLLLTLYSTALCLQSKFNLGGGSLDYLVTPPQNLFLKKTVAGSLRDLQSVYSIYKRGKSQNFETFSEGRSINETVALFYGEDRAKSAENLKDVLKKTVEFGKKHEIKHIFLILGESFSEWHFNEEFSELGLVKPLNELLENENAKKMPIFLQDSEGTIGAVDVLVAGLFNTNTPVHDMLGRIGELPTSLGVFRKLGYDTRFFYFGSATWRKIDSYTLSQGFNKIYSLGDMKDKRHGVWGVYDDEGFDFVTETTLKNEEQPSFNMILTTSYHPPYDIPLSDYGISKDNVSKFLETKYKDEDRQKEANANVIAHAAYANLAIANFMKNIVEKLPDSLVIVTGDHFDRMYPTKNRSLHVRTAVPFIIYGKGVSELAFASYSGSQIDIMPTILELVAPAGFEYHSFGTPLFSFDKDKKTDESKIALGFLNIASDRFVANADQTQYFDNKTKLNDDNEIIKNALLKEKAGRAISYYLLFKGTDIPK